MSRALEMDTNQRKSRRHGAWVRPPLLSHGVARDTRPGVLRSGVIGPTADQPADPIAVAAIRERKNAAKNSKPRRGVLPASNKF